MNIKPKLSVTDVLDNKISGFLMLISKQTWNEIKFNEELQVLHVDRDYAARILAAGKPIRVMDDVLIYHSYRVWGRNTNHLV
jgi:GT2 family glycosyltransferase